MNAISGMTTIAKSVVEDPARPWTACRRSSPQIPICSALSTIFWICPIESGKLELNCEAMDLSQLLGDLEALFRAQALEKAWPCALKTAAAPSRPAGRPPAPEPGAGERHRQRGQIHRPRVPSSSGSTSCRPSPGRCCASRWPIPALVLSRRPSAAFSTPLSRPMPAPPPAGAAPGSGCPSPAGWCR